MHIIVRMSAIAVVFFAVNMAETTFAASNKPTCMLTVVTSIGTTTIQGKGEILLQRDGTMRIIRESRYATKVVDGNGKTLSIDGSGTKSPKKNATYSYIFSNGTKKTTCSVSATFVSGSFAPSSLVTNATKPTLTGTVTGIEKVQVHIFKEGSTSASYISKTINVKRGVWEVNVLEKLPNGRYTVNVLGVKNRALNTFLSGTLRIGKDTAAGDVRQGTLVVESVPLLLGGTARAGVPVAVSYLQVINIGKDPVIIHGFTVEETGNAEAKAVMGLSIVDDSETLGGSAGGIVGETPFIDNRAFIPLDAVFQGGQMRLFTIKAVLTDTVSSYLGTQLKINVSGVDTKANIQSKFPIRGVTWTIGT